MRGIIAALQTAATGFSTKGLIAGAADARVAAIDVGSNPVAVRATADGKYVLVGNTNRFGQGVTPPLSGPACVFGTAVCPAGW
jgi:DNA-binding beta-propeller fold protein YncE